MSALYLESASKTYGSVVALDGITLRFPDGVITAVIGASGCGKSTLLKLCNGLIRPDSGQVKLFGQAIDYTALPSLRRRLGYAVQGTGLFPHLTARENITLLATLQGWETRAIEHRLEVLTSLSQLQADQLQRYPHQLSGGQQQRVGLCRAMMSGPEILLLDEPFAAIDPITRMDIQQQLLALHKAEPCTSVLVTHDIREALYLAEHIVVMEAGRVLCNDSKDALLQRYPLKEPETLLRELLKRPGA